MQIASANGIGPIFVNTFPSEIQHAYGQIPVRSVEDGTILFWLYHSSAVAFWNVSVSVQVFGSDEAFGHCSN
jgi:hypothetical protein